MQTSSPADVWETIAGDAERESPLWARSLREPAEREHLPVFSALAEQRFALALETIYEGYLLHYGRSRLFSPATRDTALLLGDYLYAHGLVRVAALGDVDAVGDLAELISLCAHLQADGVRDTDGVAWAATAVALGRGTLEPARAALREARDLEPLRSLARAAAGDGAVERALGRHAQFVR